MRSVQAIIDRFRKQIERESPPDVPAYLMSYDDAGIDDRGGYSGEENNALPPIVRQEYHWLAALRRRKRVE